MISTLQDLVAPLTETELLSHLHERTVAFIQTLEPKRFETLLDWGELNYLIESGLYPSGELGVRASMPIPTSLYIKQGRVDPAALSSMLDRGVGLIFKRLDKYVPRLCRLCHQIAKQTGEQVTAEAIVTSAGDGAQQSFNTEDTCILQIAGSNRWQLCSPPAINPPEGPSAFAPEIIPFFDEVLRAGDFLFVPAGCSRRRENGPGRSLHVSIVLEPPYGRDLVTWLANQLSADETFNAPLTRYADESALGAHEAALKARLIAQVQALSLADFLAERASVHSKEVVLHIEGTQNPTGELKREPL